MKIFDGVLARRSARRVLFAERLLKCSSPISSSHLLWFAPHRPMNGAALRHYTQRAQMSSERLASRKKSHRDFHATKLKMAVCRFGTQASHVKAHRVDGEFRRTQLYRL